MKREKIDKELKENLEKIQRNSIAEKMLEFDLNWKLISDVTGIPWEELRSLYYHVIEKYDEIKNPDRVDEDINLNYEDPFFWYRGSKSDDYLKYLMEFNYYKYQYPEIMTNARNMLKEKISEDEIRKITKLPSGVIEKLGREIEDGE